MNGMRLGIVFAGLSLACSCSAVYSAGQCSAKSYREARSEMTSRLLFIGHFHACLGAAKEYLFLG
jgi:hypothetical protein